MVIGTLTWLECGRWRDTLAADQTDEHFDQHVYEGDVYEMMDHQNRCDLSTHHYHHDVYEGYV